MRRLTRPVLPIFALALVLAGTACGGGSQDVPANSVAVVGDKAITKAEFDELLNYAKRSYQTQKRPFPKVGTPEYVQLRDQAMQFLVQRTQFEVRADDLGIDISDEAVDKRIAEYKKERHGGSDKKYREDLKAQGLTVDQAREIIRATLIQEAVFNKVTADVKVTDPELRKHYQQNKASYGTPETREVRHILVKNKGLADRLFRELRAGGDWKALAKRHSQDPASKDKGGRMTATKGQLVPEFEQVAFRIGNQGISKPVKTQYGWHVIQALGPVKKSRATPFKQVKEAIRQEVLQGKRNKKMEDWVADMRKDLEDETAYQVGYKPARPEQPATG
jgi:parvulin-like peptidyl-prolyl isomerase